MDKETVHIPKLKSQKQVLELSVFLFQHPLHSASPSFPYSGSSCVSSLSSEFPWLWQRTRAGFCGGGVQLFTHTFVKADSHLTATPLHWRSLRSLSGPGSAVPQTACAISPHIWQCTAHRKEGRQHQRWQPMPGPDQDDFSVTTSHPGDPGDPRPITTPHPRRQGSLVSRAWFKWYPWHKS